MIDLAFYIVFVLINIFVVLEDLKRMKIRNVLIFVLFLVSILFLIIKIKELNLETKNVIEKIGISVLTSVFLWISGFWPAGDAKLFIVWSIFLSPFVPMGTLEINTFVPIFFMFLPIVAAKTNKQKFVESLKKSFNSYRIYLIFTVFFGFSWIVNELLRLIGIPTNFILYFFVAAFMIEIVSRFAPFSLEVSYALFCFVRIFIDPNIYQISFWINFIKMIMAYVVFVFLFLDLAYDINVKEKKIDELKPGDVLAESIVVTLKKGKKWYEKQKTPLNAIFMKEEAIHEISDDGLTKSDIIRIKKLYKTGKLGFDTIKVHKPMPFALFIFIGGILSLIFKGNIIMLSRAIKEVL